MNYRVLRLKMHLYYGIIVCVCSLVSLTSAFTVPKPEIQVLHPKGFTVSIPHSPGLSSFEFHGNLNINIEPPANGTFSRAISQPENGFWTFKDTTTKLKVGDSINYWLLVIKDRLVYRKDHTSYVVASKDFPNGNSPNNSIEDIVTNIFNANKCNSTVISGDIHHHHHFSGLCDETPPANQSITEFFEKISNQMTVVLSQLKSLHEKTEPLMEKINSLEEVIGALLKDKDNCTKLLLIGSSPPHDSNPYEAIRGVITDRLELNDLSESIKIAKSKEEGIMFEVKSSIEKYRILQRAQERFNTAKRKIVEYDCEIGKKSATGIPEIYFRSDKMASVDSTESNSEDKILFV